MSGVSEGGWDIGVGTASWTGRCYIAFSMVLLRALPGFSMVLPLRALPGFSMVLPLRALPGFSMVLPLRALPGLKVFPVQYRIVVSTCFHFE